MAAMLCNTTGVVAVVRTRPRAIPLPLITMRKSIPGFLFPIKNSQCINKSISVNPAQGWGGEGGECRKEAGI